MEIGSLLVFGRLVDFVVLGISSGVSTLLQNLIPSSSLSQVLGWNLIPPEGQSPELVRWERVMLPQYALR